MPKFKVGISRSVQYFSEEWIEAPDAEKAAQVAVALGNKHEYPGWDTGDWEDCELNSVSEVDAFPSYNPGIRYADWVQDPHRDDR